ncbi:carbohydrate ABC transporter permease [Gluconacetobacter sacchari]|uniref:Sugar ABC transporter permease n=2 Tax=Gluconacetobacter sacchari TaxID=92759 RepID=A0A7W4IG69_9PROT|nr:sugar ABC transporter permease [Gluconacetobacter sacchari]MBB2162301.1 sugar ABC transporter permease [Gluconacetobacter sacchari]GBQ20383.1 sugar uptake ABC transporter permease protein [Gluconacetobacter sacchari DSM 12717]
MSRGSLTHKMPAWQPWALLLPALATLAALVLVPFVQTVILAFSHDPHGFVPARPGATFENFHILLGDPGWWRAARTTVAFALAAVPAETALGVVLAVLLRQLGRRPRGAVLAVMLLPWAVPGVVAARLWGWMLNDQYGVLNAVLVDVGLIRHGAAWMANPAGMLFVMVIVDIWQATPFMTLLALAGLQAVPPDVVNAARMDGASGWQCFVHVTLPLLRPTLAVAALFRLLDALRMFDLSSVLYGADMNGMTLSVFVQMQIVQFGAAGYGAASALATLGVIGLVAALFWRCAIPPRRGGDR